LASRIRRVDVTAAGHKVGVLTGRIARAELIRIAAGHGLHLVVVRTDPIARAFGIPRGVKVTAAGHKVVYVLIVPIARAEWIRKRVAIAAGDRVVVLPARIARAEWIRRDTAAGHKVVVQTVPIARFTEQEIVGIIWILDRIAADPRIEDPALRIAWITLLSKPKDEGWICKFAHAWHDQATALAGLKLQFPVSIELFSAKTVIWRQGHGHIRVPQPLWDRQRETFIKIRSGNCC